MFTTLLAVAAKIAIVGATIEVGDGTVIDDGTVLIDGAFITAVGKNVPIPPGVRRLDGEGRTVTPGLVQIGSQVGLFEIGMEAALDDSADTKGALTPAFSAADGYNPLSFRIAIERDEGVLTALLTPTFPWQSHLLAGTAHTVELRTEATVRPDARPVAMVGAFSGQVAERFTGSRAGLLAMLRTVVDDARFYARNAAAFDKAQARQLSLDRRGLIAMQPVVTSQVPLMMAVDRQADIRALLAFADAEKLQLIIYGGKESWLVTDELAKKKIPVVVVPSVAGERSFDAPHGRDDLAAVLHDAGVPVIIGTWTTDNGTTRLRQEAGIAVQNGLPRAQALQTITQTPARLLSRDAKAGTIAAGARANVVVWSGDPLEVMSVAERIIIGGALITDETRQRQLEKKYLRAQQQAP